jgi:hypothetical protein
MQVGDRVFGVKSQKSPFVLIRFWGLVFGLQGVLFTVCEGLGVVRKCRRNEPDRRGGNAGVRKRCADRLALRVLFAEGVAGSPPCLGELERCRTPPPSSERQSTAARSLVRRLTAKPMSSAMRYVPRVLVTSARGITCLISHIAGLSGVMRARAFLNAVATAPESSRSPPSPNCRWLRTSTTSPSRKRRSMSSRAGSGRRRLHRPTAQRRPRRGNRYSIAIAHCCIRTGRAAALPHRGSRQSAPRQKLSRTTGTPLKLATYRRLARTEDPLLRRSRLSPGRHR